MFIVVWGSVGDSSGATRRTRDLGDFMSDVLFTDSISPGKSSCVLSKKTAVIFFWAIFCCT